MYFIFLPLFFLSCLVLFYTFLREHVSESKLIFRNHWSFRSFATNLGNETHERDCIGALNQSILSKVAVATDNGKSKSYRLSLSSTHWRRGGSSIYNVVCARCKRTYMQVVAKDRWKGSQEGVFAPRQKNTAFQCGYSRNAVSEPCMEQQCTNYYLSLFYATFFFFNRFNKNITSWST